MRWPIGLLPPNTLRANASFTIRTRPVSYSLGAKSRPAMIDAPKAARKPRDTYDRAHAHAAPGAPAEVSTAIRT